MSQLDCLNWNNAELQWNSADITWEEACVIINIVNQIVGSKKLQPKVTLTPKEKNVLIGLIVKIQEQESIYNVEQKKEKNKKVKVTAKDIKLFLRELNQILIKAEIL